MASFGSTRERFGAIEIAPRGYINAGDNKVQNVQYPTELKDAANKEYVDRFYDVGDLKMSVRSSDFHGWMKCDGRSLSRTTYAALFSIIGTSFGSANGSSFNLPDCRGRVIGTLGQGSGLTNRTLGTMVGTETHTLSTSEMPTHNHTGTTSSDGAHTHSINDPGHTHNQTTINDDFNNSGGSPPGFTGDSAGSQTWNNISSSTTGITINSSGSHTHTFTTNSAGGGNAHNIMQPTIFMSNVFIYTGIEDS